HAEQGRQRAVAEQTRRGAARWRPAPAGLQHGRAAMMVLATALAMALSGAVTPAADGIEWQQRRASMSIAADGFVLHAPGGDRHIPTQPLATHTGSPLFDGLFAMA